MHSFHHSRGRILFEVFCALGITASCVGAWMQTNASALLGAAAAAGLYALVHPFDVRHGKPVTASVETVETLRADGQGDLLTYVAPAPPAPGPVELQSAPAAIVEPPETAEPSVAKASETRPAKAPRKASRARVQKQPNVVELSPPESVEAVVPEAVEDLAPVPVAQLFEPEPFVRQQRAVFGRKAG